ncbi:MAG: XdhC/CoxI family protein, partial [Chloroflexi bacterium]|nr:XdhC/CoxI family protein [Chloroflexota bacterium]
VLATVVRTRGSTPQKPGAKLLVRKDGSGVGTLGGGCVEGDIWFAAKEIMRHRGGPEFKDYYLNEDIAARDGLVCGGTMYFFLDPMWEANSYLPYGREILQAYDGGSVVGMATVVRAAEPQRMGARLMLREDGSTQGSLGNPELEKLALESIRKVADLGNNDSILTADGTELFIEGYTTPPTLVIMGGGHIGKATAVVAKTLGFRIYVVDDRPEFANTERFPEAEAVVVADYSQGLDQVPINANTYIVVATRGHREDDYALEAAIGTPATYVGLLGSRRKTLLIYKHLLKKGHSPEVLRRVRSPVGLDIAALTPEEIAISIMSEIIMVRRGGKGGPMQMADKYFNRALEQAEVGEWAPSLPSS